MNKRNNWKDFEGVLEDNNIISLYHFTDRDNLASIIENGGLYSWADCEDKNMKIAKPGGSMQSRELDSRKGLEHYVRVSFTRKHPMMYVAMNEGRISNPVILEIDPAVIYDKDSKFSDRNAAKGDASIGSSIDDMRRIHFDSIKRGYFNLDADEQPYFQAEVLVKNFIPLECIKNIGNFGIPIPNKPNKLQGKNAYTAQITRSTPTAFIFLVDHSVSMKRETVLHGETMTMAEAVAMIVNQQINELVLRCIKNNEVRHYYDIAVIGYGTEAYSGWHGELAGRDFVSPQELLDHPYKKIKVKEEKKTRKGMVMKEVEKVQWMEARHDGSWTHMHEAFGRAKDLLEAWMEKHQNQDCYPPTVINITDGEFNGTTKENMLQLSNELKSMFTNDGNVILFNIHITDTTENSIVFPLDKDEVKDDRFSTCLFEMSSLLPTRYNSDIAKVKSGGDEMSRHSAMAVNADMSMLIQLMDIGTPTNISQNI